MGKDLPGRDTPLEKPKEEWDTDEYLSAKYAVIAGMQTELESRNEEYARLTNDLLENGLSYRDVLSDEAVRAGSSSEQPENAAAYAHELTRLALSGKGEEVGEAAAPTAADAIVESRPDAGADYNDGIEPVTPDDLKPQKKAEIKNAETLLEDQKIALQKMVEAFNKLGWFGDKKKFKDFVAAQAFRIGTVGQGKETFLYASPKVPDSVNEEIVHYCLTLFKGNERKFKKFLGLLPDYADFSAPFTEVK
jgi:hypothetical protein